MKKFLMKTAAAIVLAAALLGSGCAGGSLLRPTPLIGKDRLVFRVIDNAEGVTYYTRDVWFDGDNYRFDDVYGRNVSIPRSDDVQVEVIGMYDYYNTTL